MKRAAIKIRSWLIAASYNLLMHGTEKRILANWRRELLQNTCGDVLEIGAGTGLNLPFYPAQLTSLTLAEPDQFMRRKLVTDGGKHQHLNFQITDWPADRVPLADSSLDSVVSTLVLCTVGCPGSSLQEIYRLLKPGGRLIFMEHVISDQERTRRWQQRLEPFWKLCAGDCRLTRDTAANIEAAGLRIETLTEELISGAPTFINRTIRGMAVKPSTP